MNYGKINLQIELKKYLSQIYHEIAVAIFLGVLPVVIYVKNEQTLDDIVAGLLATDTLTTYAEYLIALYALTTLIRWLIRFKSDNTQKKLVFIHKVTEEVGSNFLNIIRTGLGTMIGILFLALQTNIITLTPEYYTTLLLSIFCVLIASSGIAVFHGALSKATTQKKENNPLKFDRRLK